MFTKRIRSVSHLTYNERLNCLGPQKLEARRLYLDLLFLAKLKYNCIHLTLDDFGVSVSNLHNNRFLSLPTTSRITYYSFIVRTVCLWNSLNRTVTIAYNYSSFRYLLSHINFAFYLRGVHA
jgi:hypothetical protein